MNVSKIANNYVQSVRREIEFDCKPEKVWSIISKKSNLELFHPFCQKNPAIVWTEDNHEDEIHYIKGFVLKRKFVAWKKNVGYDLVLDEEDKVRAKKLGITNFEKKYNIDDMVKGDVIFCATGITSGDLANGVKDLGNEFEVNTFVLHKSQKIIKSITNIYNK